MIFGKAIGSAGVMQAFVVKDNEETQAAIPMMMSLARTVSEPTESQTIYGNAIGCVGMAQTYVFEDEEGNEVYGVIVQSETELTATENDIRLGKLAVTGIGLTNGHKEIPSYNTSEGIAVIPVNGDYSIKLPVVKNYDYTKLQVIACLFSGSLSNSVAAEKVVIEDNVYAVGNSTKLASVFKNSDTQTIEMGVVNTSGVPILLRYFTYKEIY